MDALGEARRLGFLGPGPLERQLAQGQAFARVLADRLPPDRGPLLDLGAGGGLPGLVMAVAGVAGHLILVDASLRRTDFLERAVRNLGLEERATVVRGRAEELGRLSHYREAFAAVVSRGFGPPAVTAECASPFLAPGGILLVSEPPPESSDRGRSVPSEEGKGAGGGGEGQRARGGPDPEEDRRWPAAALERLGLTPERRISCQGFSFQVLTKSAPCPQGFPRRSGVPRKRPLFP